MNGNIDQYLKEIVEELRGIKETLKSRPQSMSVGQSSVWSSFAGGIKSWFKKENPYVIPASILIAALLIVGALLMTRNSSSGSVNTGSNNNGGHEAVAGATATDNVAKVTKDDHIRGDEDAKVVVVEFSDLQCPFCQRFHDTMRQVMDEYDGQVAWVYRHFPLESIHPRAFPQAVASECVAELGGNDKFWQFIDAVFASTQDNSDQQLAQMAQNIGINRSSFESCLQSDNYDNLINEQAQNAQASGGRGTPYSVVIAEDGTTFAVNGAQPFSSVKSTIDQALSR